MKRCAYCGHRARSYACRYHRHLAVLDPNRRACIQWLTMKAAPPPLRVEWREAVQAARERGD
jgi:hypothetical protein